MRWFITIRLIIQFNGSNMISGGNIVQKLNLSNLTDCYDELGNRYQLPVYLLSNPINFIDESTSAQQSSSEGGGGPSGSQSGSSHLAATLANPELLGKPVQYKVRISSLPQDFHLLTLREKSTIYHGKVEIHKDHGVEIQSQRWFFAGKVLVDSAKLKDLKISEDYIIQVIDVSPLNTFEVTEEVKEQKETVSNSSPSKQASRDENTIEVTTVAGDVDNTAVATIEAQREDPCSANTNNRTAQSSEHLTNKQMTSPSDDGDQKEGTADDAMIVDKHVHYNSDQEPAREECIPLRQILNEHLRPVSYSDPIPVVLSSGTVIQETSATSDNRESNPN